MKKNKILLIALFSSFASAMRAKKTAKYVFLFIGDGMGDNAIYATELYKSTLENPIAIEPLAMSQFPAKTFMTTMSVNSLTTDSSAAATGYKTDNHVVAMDSTLQIATSNFDYFARGGVHTIGNVNNKNSITVVLYSVFIIQVFIICLVIMCKLKANNQHLIILSQISHLLI